MEGRIETETRIKDNLKRLGKDDDWKAEELRWAMLSLFKMLDEKEEKEHLYKIMKSM